VGPTYETMTTAPTPRRRVHARDVWVVLANTLALGLGLFFLWEMRTIVTWFLVSVFIWLALRPVLLALTQRGVKKGLAVAMIALTVAGFFALLLGTFVPLLLDQGRQLVENAPELMNRLERWDPVRWVVQRFGRDYEPETFLREQMQGAAGHAVTVARSILEGVVGTITVTSLTVFLLIFGDELAEKALAWVRPERREYMRGLAHRITKKVGGYVVGTLIVATIGGAVMGVTLAILGVPYFVPLALAMVVLGIIPFLGSALGAVTLIGVTFASQGWKAALICAGVYVVYQQLENEVLQPIVQRRTISMNPLLVALALLAGTALAGIVGTLLALPVAGALQILLGDMLERRRASWGEKPSPAEAEPPRRRRFFFWRAREA
jgi:predicted PurR-regulated permease PerM